MKMELSYLKLPDNRAKVVCACGWESESFRRGPFDPNEALAAYSVEHLSCHEIKPLVDLSRETDCIRIWSWDEAPEGFKKYSKHDGDEDGVAWVPNKYIRGDDFDFYVGISRLWMMEENPDVVKFDNGILIIWGHS